MQVWPLEHIFVSHLKFSSFSLTITISSFHIASFNMIQKQFSKIIEHKAIAFWSNITRQKGLHINCLPRGLKAVKNGHLAHYALSWFALHANLSCLNLKKKLIAAIPGCPIQSKVGNAGGGPCSQETQPCLGVKSVLPLSGLSSDKDNKERSIARNRLFIFIQWSNC